MRRKSYDLRGVTTDAIPLLVVTLLLGWLLATITIASSSPTTTYSAWIQSMTHHMIHVDENFDIPSYVAALLAIQTPFAVAFVVTDRLKKDSTNDQLEYLLRAFTFWTSIACGSLASIAIWPIFDSSRQQVGKFSPNPLIAIASWIFFAFMASMIHVPSLADRDRVLCARLEGEIASLEDLRASLPHPAMSVTARTYANRVSGMAIAACLPVYLFVVILGYGFVAAAKPSLILTVFSISYVALELTATRRTAVYVRAPKPLPLVRLIPKKPLASTTARTSARAATPLTHSLSNRYNHLRGNFYLLVFGTLSLLAYAWITLLALTPTYGRSWNPAHVRLRTWVALVVLAVPAVASHWLATRSACTKDFRDAFLRKGLDSQIKWRTEERDAALDRLAAAEVDQEQATPPTTSNPVEHV